MAADTETLEILLHLPLLAEDQMEGENPNDQITEEDHALDGYSQMSQEAQPSLYTPNVASNGPFHRGDLILINTEDQKRSYCRRFIERSKTKNLESIVSFLQDLESKMEGGNPDNDFQMKTNHVHVVEEERPILSEECCINMEIGDQKKRSYCRNLIERSESKNMESIVTFLQELESKMEGGNPDGFVIEINELLGRAKPLLTYKCCIYKVPHDIRKLKEDAYTPKAVSIGPFHRGNENLLHMEEHKKVYCKQFIERSRTHNLVSFVSRVQELEPEARDCYSHNIKLSKEEHAKVILVDCCFILEFLLEIYFTATRGDPLFLPRRLVHLICNDLFLLENQVPFFILEELYNLVFPSTLSSSTGNHTHPSLLLLALFILPETITTRDNVEQYLSSVGVVAHFTDLYRKLLLRSSQLFHQPSQSSRKGKVTHLYSATELNELGVKFKVNKNSKCMLDLKLSCHTLRIPFIQVEDQTEVAFRNLLAFEQCHCIDESYLADYIIFLDFLINTDKDVDFLIKEGIMENWLGDSNAVAKMFNNLTVNIVSKDFNEKYSLIFESLNAFCAICCVKTFATLKRDYCNTAWQAAATFAAIFLLILTVIQTVFSVLQGIH